MHSYLTSFDKFHSKRCCLDLGLADVELIKELLSRNVIYTLDVPSVNRYLRLRQGR